ncbi:unnamed protein product [Ranitomeya imitator]|uniref:RRM domain-containing protein n=1 Tax=Ranitomeya imitator TaxID=111125 RepID=A0ABN9KPB7_9NEOB|nr:unnamed protein product [Ranitomeya imitator]
MASSTDVIQVTNVSPSASTEQMKTLFGFLGKIEDLRLFPPDDSPLPVTSRVCFVKFHDPDCTVVAQHLTNTVFVDRALIVVPYAEGIIPDESKALSLVAPVNAVTGLLPGGGLLPTPNPLGQLGAVPLAALGAPTLDPTLAALTLPGANLNSQSLAADQLLKLMSTVDPKLNHVTAGLVSPSLKSDSNKDIEEAMKRIKRMTNLKNVHGHVPIPGEGEHPPPLDTDVQEAGQEEDLIQSPGAADVQRAPEGGAPTQETEAAVLDLNPGSHFHVFIPRTIHSSSMQEKKLILVLPFCREKKREEKEKKRSKTPPKSYSTSRRSRSTSRDKRRRKSRSASRSPKKMRSPKRKASRTPSPRRHKKEKKKDKDREKSRDERERSSSKKKKSKDKDKEKDKEKERERRSESEKDVKQVTRNYDEEEQGYDSDKEKRDEYMVTEASPPLENEDTGERSTSELVKDSKVNGDDHHEEDMDMSD